MTVSEPAASVDHTTYRQEIGRNRRKTWLILTVFFVLIVTMGVAIDILVGGGLWIALIAFVIAVFMAFFAYFKSDSIALAATRAKPADGPEYRRYHNLVEGLCIAAGLPKPRLYVVNDPAPNAFATGRNPEHAAIAVTTGLLDTMNRVELEGVLAHELSHIKNYDILISTTAVVAVGAITLISELGLRFMWFGGRRDRRDNTDSGPAGMIIALARDGVACRCTFRRCLDAVLAESEARTAGRRTRRRPHALSAGSDLCAEEAPKRSGRRA